MNPEKTCASYEGCRGDGCLCDLSDSGSGREVYCDCAAGMVLRKRDADFVTLLEVMES